MAQLTITRNVVSRAIKRDAGVNIKQANQLIDQILAIIAGALKQKKVVTIRQFGSMRCHYKAQRIGRNPKTMEEAIIPAHNVVRFKVAPTLKNRINANINVKIDI
jgi:integration host factor subunit alpha